ncbi:MAG: lipid-binding SYLF domain-containing protein [Thermodesulfobacteriota bacterium]
MKKVILFIALMAVFFLVLPPVSMAGSKEEKRVEIAAEILTDIMSIPEKEIPPSLLRNAHGIAIIPGVIKIGFIVGGRYGKGIIAVRTKDGEWSNPAFLTLGGGSIGWQIGAQSTDIILVFKSSKSVESMGHGKFTLGADASIAAGPMGRHAEFDTDILLRAEIYSYSRSRGLFAGVSLVGAILHIDNKSNTAFYGKEDISTDDIFANKKIKAPDAAKELRRVLSKYAVLGK